MIYVVAPRYKDHIKFIRSQKLRDGIDARWVHDHRSFRGRRGDYFALVADYWTKDNFQEIIEAMAIADFKCMYRSDQDVVAYKPNILNLMKRSNLHFKVNALPTVEFGGDVDQLFLDLEVMA